MKIYNRISIIGFISAFVLSSCILEDVEPEYDIVGAVGTIATLSASNTLPVEGETVTFTMTVFSEHEPASELRMNRVDGGTVSNLDTKVYTTWNTEDSYQETFTFVVPGGTADTAVVIQFELVTVSDFSTTRQITLNVQEE